MVAVVKAVVVGGLVAVVASSTIFLLRRRAYEKERREFIQRYVEKVRSARAENGARVAAPSSGDVKQQRGSNSGGGKVGTSDTPSDFYDSDVDDGEDMGAEGGRGEVDGDAVVKVIYGSESGNAEALAKGFVMNLRDRGVPAVLIDPSNWPYLDAYFYRNKRQVPLFSPLQPGRKERRRSDATTTPPQQVFIFIVATAGEGEPAGNFTRLFEEMQASVHRSSAGHDATVPLPFKDLYYSVFALGDSSYKYYCRCGTDTNTLLKRGGGVSLHRVGFSDASNGLQEDVFDEWQECIIAALKEKCNLKVFPPTLSPPKPELELRFVPAEDGVEAPPFLPPPPTSMPSATHPALIRLVEKVQLSPMRASDVTCVYRFVFETEGSGISYQAGDHFSVYPVNPPEIVERCARILSLTEAQLNTPVELYESAAPAGQQQNMLPSRVPLRVVLERYLDLCGRPKKAVLRVIAKYCADKAERDEFLERLLPSPEIKKDGAGEAAHSTPPARLRTVLDYMELYPSCCSAIPLGQFIEIFPRIRPRHYSIASDSLSHGTRLDIMCRILSDGLASDYLVYRTAIGDAVYAYVRASSFHLPERIGDGRPILMIGPGTGAASMVGMCYKREVLMRREPTATYGPATFFFGAHHYATEYIVKDELERWAMSPEEVEEWDLQHPSAHASLAANCSKSGRRRLPSPVLTLLECAFSRDQEEKVYVTHLIARYKDLIYDLLTTNAGGGCLVFLSGDASVMAKDVDRAFMNLLQEKGPMSRIQALEFIRRMEKDHRYLKDVY